GPVVAERRTAAVARRAGGVPAAEQGQIDELTLCAGNRRRDTARRDESAVATSASQMPCVNDGFVVSRKSTLPVALMKTSGVGVPLKVSPTGMPGAGSPVRASPC